MKKIKLKRKLEEIEWNIKLITVKSLIQLSQKSTTLFKVIMGKNEDAQASVVSSEPKVFRILIRLLSHDNGSVAISVIFGF